MTDLFSTPVVASWAARVRRWPRQGQVGALFGLALLYVAVLGVIGGGEAGPTETGRPLPRDDGSVRAAITRVDNDQFTIGLSLAVTGPDGKVIAGLTPEDIEVFEDGEKVALADFRSAGQQPIHTGLVIDRSGSMGKERRLEGARQAATTFLGLMHDQLDSLGLYLFDDRVEVALPMGALDPARRATAMRAIAIMSDGGGTELFKGLLAALDNMRGAAGRRIILAMTDGQSASRELIPEVIAQARTQGVPIYTIGLGPESDIDVAVLRQLADESGGRYFHAPQADQLEALYRSIGEALQNEYSFTYRSPHPAEDGLRRAIQVIVRRGEVGTRASGGYNVGGMMSVRSRDAESADVSGSDGGSGLARFLGILTPLAVALGLAFALPYRRLVRAHPPTPSSVAAAPAAPVPPAAPPAPARPSITPPAPQGEVCPGGCGRVVPGTKGSRYCIVCELTY